ncbi:MAG: hypothetical protein ACP5NQ_03685 [Vulcanisaeta sp.]
MVFLLFDLETCSAGDKPTINDEIIGFGIRDCDKDGKCGNDYVVTLSNYKCNSINDCEREILRELMDKIDEYLKRAKDDAEKAGKSSYSVLIIGWNIRSFDLPLLANRLYKQKLRELDEALEFISIKQHLIYLDLYDFIKSIIFPRVRMNLNDAVEAISKCLNVNVINDGGEGSKELIIKTCGRIKRETEGKLNDNVRVELGKYVKDRLTHDLNQLSALYMVLVSNIDIKKCVMSELINAIRRRRDVHT